MKTFLKFMLATAVLFVMTSFTNSTVFTPVKDVIGYHSLVVQPTQDYNYQPAIQTNFPVFNYQNEITSQVPGGVQIIGNELCNNNLYLKDTYVNQPGYYWYNKPLKFLYANDKKSFYKRI